MSVIPIRRILTDTPLARRHQVLVDGGAPRRHRAIPWARFKPADHPAPARALARTQLCALARGEYRAVDHFARLASALALRGVPFDLIAACAAIPGDEIRHADLALRGAALMGDGEPVIDCPDAEERWPLLDSLPALDRLMVELPAIGETLALALLCACRERAREPMMRALLDSIVADEVHHARFGWYYLAWRAPAWSQAERQNVADRAGEIVMGVEQQFWMGRDAPRGSKRAARALGVLDSQAQRAAIRRVMESEIVPALDALGLGASLAWRFRRRGR